ncbi:MAG: type II toxin-antitoxin system Phd/YefM family antitoxin [Nitrospinae bacterium]|nr:type II toxin-antitoxin system Phd/YefM family antitoxin [Nitrospinota bacterium]
MTQISANNAKEEINGAIAKVVSDGEDILIYGENGAIAALIPIEEYELLRRMEEEEEKLDVAEAERRLADPAQTPVPYETVRKGLGLD